MSCMIIHPDSRVFRVSGRTVDVDKSNSNLEGEKQIGVYRRLPDFLFTLWG